MEGDPQLEDRAFGKVWAGSGISVSDMGITGGWLFYLTGNAKPCVNLLGDSQRAPPWKCCVLRLGLHLQLGMGSLLTLPVQASPGKLFLPSNFNDL